MEFGRTITFGDILSIICMTGSVIAAIVAWVKESKTKKYVEAADAYYRQAQEYYEKMEPFVDLQKEQLHHFMSEKAFGNNDVTAEEGYIEAVCAIEFWLERENSYELDMGQLETLFHKGQHAPNPILAAKLVLQRLINEGVFIVKEDRILLNVGPEEWRKYVVDTVSRSNRYTYTMGELERRAIDRDVKQ